ncbi:thiamine diphosphokinase [Thalassorhabdomicrobium marinisediminis]|uniref:thiamine diphosphokinase n=1 Tax=Thalassorhabdomicrobium marinisediminis TaxID=2170577 RepID=UPI00248F9804|nr:thiamine diphosphokinase [Thalassorhabdomicrobium marinisediminis]
MIGGGDVSPDTLSEALKWGETVVCADGGADVALRAGLRPAAVIGDLDSISDDARAAFDAVLHPVAEQDSTDFDKALRHVTAPLVIGVGFLGRRFDHSLAALHVLLKYRHRPVILLGEDDVVFVPPPLLVLDTDAGQRVSLLPLMPGRVSTRGLRWDVAGAEMSMADFIGSSNEATGPRVEVHSDGGLALILPRAALGAAVRAVQADVPAG